MIDTSFALDFGKPFLFATRSEGLAVLVLLRGVSHKVHGLKTDVLSKYMSCAHTLTNQFH